MSNNNLTKIRYITREAEKEIKKYLTLPQIIALVGPRRSGKTTLLLHLKEKLKNSLYLSFENQKILELFEADIENFAKIHLEKRIKYLILDEFHYAKNGGKNLKYLFDFYPGKKIIISGSSASELTIQAIKYLVGRVITITLYPFSFAEFLSAKKTKIHQVWKTIPATQLTSSPIGKIIQRLFEEYLVWGGYPEVVLQDNLETKKTLLANIYSVLFLREVRDFLSLSADHKLKSLIRALALQTGNLINYQELSQTASLDYKTLKRYLNFLRKTFICELVSTFFTNKRKELVKNPKIYFWDTGLRNAVIDNFSTLPQRTDAGVLLENAVFRALGEENEVKFWRTKAKAEVDFVLESKGKSIPLEVKSGIKTVKVSPSLRSFIQTYKPERAFVLTFSFAGKRKIDSTPILLQPAWKTEPLMAN